MVTTGKVMGATMVSGNWNRLARAGSTIGDLGTRRPAN